MNLLSTNNIYPQSYIRTRKLMFLALLTTFALALHMLELSLPNPTPWLRLGLANIIILATLALFGFKAGLAVNFLRIILGAFLSGSIFSPAFLMSFGGGLSSVLVMGLTLKLGKNIFSLIGVSVIGAYVHILTQLWLAYWILIQHPGIFSLLPLFLVISLLTGLINGLGAEILKRQMEHLIGKA
ncbi:MAG: Gx transporter family protein [Candidatus Schekmanbacteria bacterium]|nr:Gx transporter family protein [Candidatus Schekmanbacteria bacterium]